MKVLFVFHNAGLTGASVALCSIVEWLKVNTDIEMSFLFRDEGIIRNKVSRYGKIFHWEIEQSFTQGIFRRLLNKITFQKSKLKKMQLNIEREKFDIIYFNTILCSELIRHLSMVQSKKIWHIHELALAVNYYGLKHLKVSDKIDYIIANSFSTQNFLFKSGLKVEKSKVIYPFINPEEINKLTVTNITKKDLNIPDDAFLIGTSGTIMDRKGFEAFLTMIVVLDSIYPDNKFYYIWVGGYLKQQKSVFDYDLENSGKSYKIRLVGEQENPFPYYKLFDVFVSFSKEESFGLSAIEAAYLRKPILCFNNTGGIEEIVRESGNITVPYLNVYEMAKVIIKLSENDNLRNSFSEKSYQYSNKFYIDRVMPEWLDFIKKTMNEKLK